MANTGDDPRINPYAAPVTDFDDDLLDPDLYPEGYRGAVVYGSFWQRFVAFFVDAIIQNILASVVGFGFGMVYGSLALSNDWLQDNQELLLKLGGYGIGIVISWLYCASQDSSVVQATPGKKLMGLKVTDLEGNRISFGRATGRHFAKFLSSFFMIGYLVQPFNPRKQTWHDSLAGTLVVKA